MLIFKKYPAVEENILMHSQPKKYLKKKLTFNLFQIAC